MSNKSHPAKLSVPVFDPKDAKTLSDRVCDAAMPLLFAPDTSDVGRLVEAALKCASALESLAEQVPRA